MLLHKIVQKAGTNPKFVMKNTGQFNFNSFVIVVQQGLNTHLKPKFGFLALPFLLTPSKQTLCTPLCVSEGLAYSFFFKYLFSVLYPLLFFKNYLTYSKSKVQSSNTISNKITYDRCQKGKFCGGEGRKEKQKTLSMIKL